jgi:pimeloyl-ACP methyl ester carboxylesterase
VLGPVEAVTTPPHPCTVPGIQEEVRCATYAVWENREAKKGRKIGINVVILPAKGPEKLPDPIFFFGGGPGEGIAGKAAGVAENPARQKRDVVLVDQRGTGRSNTLDCEFWGHPLDLRRAAGDVFPMDAVRACKERLEKVADLRYYTTPLAIDDVDEIRAWLGYGKINLSGGSYGTRAAEVYLQRHPESVRTVTLIAVAPLDERIGAGALARRARFRPTLHGAPHASEVPALRLLTDHAERIPRERLLPILDALATATSMIGVQLFSSRVPLAHSLVLEGLGTQAGLVIGSLAGAGALVSSLAAFGRAIRATAVAEGEEAGAAGPADPAFASAVEAVFSRLALSEPFCRWAGIPTDPDFTSDLRFELALGPRLEWAYLSLALEGRAGAERAVLDALRRAAGRDPDWETTARTWGREVAGASALRGTVLGLLVEDRLQTRFGRQWFLDRGATRFLLECWHGEAGETAESMAGALGLGTIEPAPIVDAFRP